MRNTSACSSVSDTFSGENRNPLFLTAFTVLHFQLFLKGDPFTNSPRENGEKFKVPHKFSGSVRDDNSGRSRGSMAQALTLYPYAGDQR